MQREITRGHLEEIRRVSREIKVLTKARDISAQDCRIAMAEGDPMACAYLVCTVRLSRTTLRLAQGLRKLMEVLRDPGRSL